MRVNLVLYRSIFFLSSTFSSSYLGRLPCKSGTQLLLLLPLVAGTHQSAIACDSVPQQGEFSHRPLPSPRITCPLSFHFTASNFREPRKPINPRPQSICHLALCQNILFSSHHETPHFRSGYPKIISKDYTRLSCFLFCLLTLFAPVRSAVGRRGPPNEQLQASSVSLSGLSLGSRERHQIRHQTPLYPRHHPGIRPGLPNSLALASQLRGQAITRPPRRLAGTVYKSESPGEGENQTLVEARLDLGRVRYV